MSDEGRGAPRADAGRPTIAICVPVRNERVRLPALLRALAGQQRAPGHRAEACFLFDGCTDGSAELVAAMAPPLGLAITTADLCAGAAPNAGRARRAAMALGLDRLGGSEAILLTTDADSVPAPGWIAAAVRSLASCDVVAGWIERDGDDAGQTRVEAYYDRLYALRRTIDPVPWEGAAHHFTGGANLGFRADVYRALGGFAEVASGEDALIVDEAARGGYRVRRDPALRVQTSARRDGRASGGLARALAQLDRGEPTVGDPAAAAWQYRRQAAARAGFARLGDHATAAALAAFVGLPADHLVGVARDCPNAEAFAMRVVPAAPGATRLLPLAEAEQALAALEGALVEEAA